MRRNLFWLTIGMSISIFGCGDGDSKDNTSNNTNSNDTPQDISHPITDRTVSGVSQKGPFISGSPIIVQELRDESLLQTGNVFRGKISNNRGEFSIASVSLASQYALLEVTGYYRNEITGENSDGSITMNALVDISDREHVNINLLTHLETDRVRHLVTIDKKKFAEAKKQAREEILTHFGFSGNFGNAEDMNIFGDTSDAAALLAMSVIVQGNLSESNFTERITLLSSDIEDGTIDETEIWDKMAYWALTTDLEEIRHNIEKWGESVPAFEEYVKAFWRDHYGLGPCDPSKVGAWQQSNDVCFICREDGWDQATCQESAYCVANGDCPKDGSILGDFYVCDGERYRVGNPFELTVMKKGCTSYNRGASLQVPGAQSYEICSDTGWVPDLSKNVGTFVDTRDNKEYRTVTIGQQTWLGENLRFEAEHGSACLDGDADCSQYGRLYEPDATKEACPSGYRVPSKEDWTELVTFTSQNMPAHFEYCNQLPDRTAENYWFSCNWFSYTPASADDPSLYKCMNHRGYEGSSYGECSINTQEGEPYLVGGLSGDWNTDGNPVARCNYSYGAYGHNVGETLIDAMLKSTDGWECSDKHHLNISSDIYGFSILPVVPKEESEKEKMAGSASFWASSSAPCSDKEGGNTDCLAFLEFSCEPLKEWFERRWQTDNSPHAIRCIKD